MISLTAEENLEVDYEKPMSRVIRFDTGITFVVGSFLICKQKKQSATEYFYQLRN